MTELQKKFLDFFPKHKPTAEQEEAIFTAKSVVAAGAGSGKTATLSQRFLWLMMNGIPADKILTITFTKDAAASMKSKIFKTLKSAADANLIEEKQLNAFSNATICTTDSFCSEIAKTDCVRFGIPVNFQIEEEHSLEEVSSLITDTVLEEFKDHPMLNRYLSYYTVSNIKETLLCLARDHICISDPIKTDDIISSACNRFSQNRITQLESDLDNVFYRFTDDSEVEDKYRVYSSIIEDFQSKYQHNKATGLRELIKKTGKTGSKTVKEYKAEINRIASELLLCVCASDESSIELLKFICTLIDSYQEKLLNHKKETGLLTFRDVMKLAINILKTNAKVRQFYNEKYDAVMVDEFQDNNEDNKILIYLLAVTGDYRHGENPDRYSINKNKIFMVGDEKQSIYKFRGADVSVFKGIAEEVGQESVCKLTKNFRSGKNIIDAVDSLFEKILESGNEKYEASFERLNSPLDDEPDSKPDINSTVSFQFLTEEKKDPEGCLSSCESEAFAVAEKIRDIVVNNPQNYQIKKKDENGNDVITDPAYSDIAILLKTGTHQGNYEKALRYHHIPVDVKESKTLTKEAVVCDFYSLLQLTVYGESDGISRLVFLKGPFCRLTDREVFIDEDGICEKLIEEHTDELRHYCANHCIAQIISYIWNEKGYRYLIVSDEYNQAFEEHYDYLFKLACQFDENNKTLVDFLTYLRPMIGKDCPIKDIAIQKEETLGVKIMSIHKSKGLEFPIVFVADMQSGASEPGGFKPRITVSENGKISLPYCPVNDDSSLENPVYLENNIDAEKDNAETKRILYVAATRAQFHLIFSGVIPAKPEKEKDCISKFGTLERSKRHSQLDYFLNAINYGYEDNPEYIVTPKTGPSFKMEMCDFGYKKSEDVKAVSEPDDPFISDVYGEEVSSVPVFEKLITKVTEDENYYDKYAEVTFLEVDSYLTTREDRQSFGSLVHKMIENAINENDSDIAGFFENSDHRDFIYECAEKLKNKFTECDFFRKLKDNYRLYSERAFLLLDDSGNLKNGVIDLLCESDDKIIIIDYKTDAKENPELHINQLKTYKTAAGEIYKRPVETYLYYIRSGKFIKVGTD